MNSTAAQFPATEAQVNYINSLIDERDLQPLIAPGTTIDDIKAQVGNLTKGSASKWIARLKELPRRASEGSVGGIETNVPAGHYAVTGEDGTTDFYRVDRPEEGRWNGYTFVKLQLSDEYERISFANTKVILAKIEAAGPREAAIRYGKELGRCGVCNRTLTNNESIELGIGPVCAEGRNW